jgi:transposase InsO family protein
LADLSDSIVESYLAETLLMRGKMADAEVAVQDAFAFVERSGERFWLADLYRVDGQIALRRTETDRERAEGYFLKAIEIAHGQEARMLELRAAADTFEAPAPNRKWIADFTYVWTAEGWLYVAVVIDLFSRRVVGWR